MKKNIAIILCAVIIIFVVAIIFISNNKYNDRTNDIVTSQESTSTIITDKINSETPKNFKTAYEQNNQERQIYFALNKEIFFKMEYENSDEIFEGSLEVKKEIDENIYRFYVYDDHACGSIEKAIENNKLEITFYENKIKTRLSGTGFSYWADTDYNLKALSGDDLAFLRNIENIISNEIIEDTISEYQNYLNDLLKEIYDKQLY